MCIFLVFDMMFTYEANKRLLYNLDGHKELHREILS